MVICVRVSLFHRRTHSRTQATLGAAYPGAVPAVAGVSAQQIAQAGVSVEKFALGGSGIFTGWAVLDRLIDCGVRPEKVVMAYGGVHVLDTGAMMDRTTNYDLLKGPRASHAFA